MRFKVKKGKHYSTPLSLGLYIGKKTLQRKVCFLSSCRYDLESVDNADINKLFGIGYLSFNKVPHHVESARFGWVYDSALDAVDIYAYTYSAGVRMTKFLGKVFIGEQAIYTITITIKDGIYYFDVTRQFGSFRGTMPYTHKMKIGYFLGLYFGGNREAPHDIEIIRERL